MTRPVVCVAFLQPVDLSDVGVVERRQHARFPREARTPVVIVREPGRQDFHCDITVQLGVARAVDVPHPARTEQGADHQRAEPLAGQGTIGGHGLYPCGRADQSLVISFADLRAGTRRSYRTTARALLVTSAFDSTSPTPLHTLWLSRSCLSVIPAAFSDPPTRAGEFGTDKARAGGLPTVRAKRGQRG